MKTQNRLQNFFEIRLGKHLQINFWLFPIICFSIIGKYSLLFFLSYLSAVVHEFAHIGCSKILGVGISKIHLYPFGVAAHLDGGYIKNSEKEFFIALSGPAASLVFWGILELGYRIFSVPVFAFAADANLGLCIINLLPALPLDGGRVVKSILTSRYGILRSYNFMIKLSRVIIFLLIFAALVVFFVSGFNFSLILISAFLLQNLCNEQQAVTTITVKEILASSKKIENFGSLPTKSICVFGDKAASGILRLLSYDCFYIVYVLGKNSEIKKTVTETQILNALTTRGVRTKYSEI